jgi:hypothetical protein
MNFLHAWFVVIIILLAGCSSHPGDKSLRSGDSISVSVHGVNYTGDPATLIVSDPNDTSNSAGGDSLEPYSAGGIMCCFTLPKKWRTGLKLKVHSIHWLPPNEKGELSTVEKDYDVELPQYLHGEVGELWLIRTVEGGVDVVSSDLQPDHPQWPGKVKGWPVPSREYMLERWKLRRKLVQDNVDNYRDLLSLLETDPVGQRKKAWDVYKNSLGREMDRFSGPDDPEFHKYLIDGYKKRLAIGESELEKMSRKKP